MKVTERGINPIVEVEFVKDYLINTFGKIVSNRFFDIKDVLLLKKTLGSYTSATINRIINCCHIAQTWDSSYCYTKDNYVICVMVNGAGNISLKIDDMDELKSVYSYKITK